MEYELGKKLEQIELIIQQLMEIDNKIETIQGSIDKINYELEQKNQESNETENKQENNNNQETTNKKINRKNKEEY